MDKNLRKRKTKFGTTEIFVTITGVLQHLVVLDLKPCPLSTNKEAINVVIDVFRTVPETGNATIFLLIDKPL